MLSRVLVCGLGSIGRRHVLNLKKQGVEVHVWRSRTELLESARVEFDVDVHYDLTKALSFVDGVVIATEPPSHVPIAIQAAKAGKALYIEKPLSNSMAGVTELEKVAKDADIPVEIGCQLRSHPNLTVLSQHLQSNSDGPLLTFRFAVGQRLDNWRPEQDYRKGFSANLERGGGALFELIHEIDLVQWLLGPVSAVNANLTHISGLEIAADDLANLTLVLTNAAVGQVQLDMISPVYRRGFELVYRDAIWRWHYATGIVRRETSSGDTVMHSLNPTFERNELFIEHINYFLRRLHNPSLPSRCSLADGIAALKIVMAARLANQKKMQISIQPCQ